MDPKPELIAGRYLVRRSLGRGAMGRVIHVEDQDAGSVPRAMKLLEAAELRDGFLAEFELLKKLAHPGFPRAYDLGVDPTYGLLAVYDLCEGAPLHEARPSDPIAVAADLLRAVDHLHRLGYTHGDLAPANLLWSEGQGCRILDLGAAGATGSGAGATSGVLHFAAPERLEGHALTPASDLWSLGAVLFGLAHHRHPFPRYPAAPIEAGPDRRGLAAHPLDPVCDRLLDRDPGARPPSAAAALALLEEHAGRELPLVPREELARRLAQVPYVDAGQSLQGLSTEIDLARTRGEPIALAITAPGGQPGCGRSRLLAELSQHLAARGVRAVTARALPGDGQGALTRRLAGLLGVDLDPSPQPASLVARALLKAANDARAPVAMLIDDLDLADPLSAEVVRTLVRTATRLPDRAPGLILVVVDGVQGPRELAPWTAADLANLLGAVFPGRRVGVHACEPCTARARGNPALTLAILEALAHSGGLEVDATSVRIGVEAAQKVELPASLEASAALEVARLATPEARRAAALLAHAGQPLPAEMLEGQVAALSAAGVAVWVRADTGPAVTLRSDAHAAPARANLGAREAHQELAARWGLRDGTEARTEALRHALIAGGGGAVEDANQALKSLSSAQVVRLLPALLDAGWPPTAEAALLGADSAAGLARDDLATRLYERAVDLADDPVIAARAMARRGTLEAKQTRHATALAALQAALVRGGSALGPEDRAEILAGLARSALLSGSREAADRYASEGLASVTAAQLGVRGNLLYTRGLAAWYRGALDEAEPLLTEALDAVRTSGDRIEEGAVVTALGLVAHRRGKLPRAAELYGQALALGEETGDDTRLLSALQNLGVVQHEQGQWADALETYRHAMAVAESLQQPLRAVQLASNLGVLWRYLGELDEARAVLERGLELARREPNRMIEGPVLATLAGVALGYERWEEAESLLKEAIEATHETANAAVEAECLIDLARLHLVRQTFQRARESAEAALAIAGRIERRDLAVMARVAIAEAHRASVHGDRAAAREAIDAALGDLEAVTNPDARWPVLLEAARHARQQGDQGALARHAAETRRILRQLEDAVPAKHREKFRGVRERRVAWLELGTGEAAPPALGAAGQAEERWGRLIEINKRLNTEYDIERLLEYIMDSAIWLSGAERGFLLLASEVRENNVSVRVARNIDQENIRNTRFKISWSIAHRVIEEGERILTVDAMEDERYREQLSVHDLRLRSVLCLPMRSRGKVLGAIYLDNRFRAAAFGETDVRFMEAFADQAGIALGNAQLLAAKEQTQRALEASQKEVQALNAKLEMQLAERTAELEETHRVVIRQQRQLEAKHTYGSIIGSSARLRQVFAVMDRLLDNNIPVLIEGESGTGKELVARAIHYGGNRKDQPFLAVNCGAIPANLLESELFGHVRGSFTGATADKKGLFEAADAGSMLLDELGELPLDMQVKLLRVLQNGEVKRVGATKTNHVDVRIIAATNRRLEEEVAQGRFREDLYYRLSVVRVELPGLRERREDIPLLVQHFLAENKQTGLSEVKGVSPAALALLERYAWPGNVRQLEMVLKNASLFAEGEILEPIDFHSFPEIVGYQRPTGSAADLAGRSLADVERDAIIRALEDHRGNKKKAAEALGIDRRTLYNKLRAYHIVIEKELHVV
jgi:transcriptional regulator with GAF, ATPase, and Fis domain/tetratricopeptide (TPR) repeat protein